MKLAYGLVALLVIAVLAIVVFAGLLMQASAENDALKAELAASKNNLSSTQKELDASKAEVERKDGELLLKQAEISNLSLALQNKTDEMERLEANLNQSEEELEEARNQLNESKEEIRQVETEAAQMQEEINESIQWFRDNSALPSTLKSDRFINKVEKGCVEEGTLRLACVSLLMEEELGFTYKSDPSGDRLYSIEEIIARKGGDCEDYSLFFKAALNRLRQEDLQLEGWTEGAGKYTIYEETERYWYFDDAEGIWLGSVKDSNPYAVCYFFETGDVSLGHCVIMLTNKTIDSPEDISTENLKGSPLFEPQDGRFLGRVGGKFSACSDGEDGCEGEINSLAFLISDDDLYEFSSGEWHYYSGYRDRIGEIMDKLKGMEG